MTEARFQARVAEAFASATPLFTYLTSEPAGRRRDPALTRNCFLHHYLRTWGLHTRVTIRAIQAPARRIFGCNFYPGTRWTWTAYLPGWASQYQADLCALPGENDQITTAQALTALRPYLP